MVEAAGMTIHDSLNTAWAEWGNSTLLAKWRKANPGEASKLDAYRAGGTQPSLATPVGRALVAETAAWLASAPPAPQPSSSLMWPRPVLTNPLVVELPATGTADFTFPTDRDVQFTSATRRREGPVSITGGRNIMWPVGLDHTISNTTSQDYRDRRLLVITDTTGVFHIEGWWGHGPGLTEGINIKAPQMILQIQNSRVEDINGLADGFDSQHPDIIQTWWGPAEVRIHNFTGRSSYQGFLFMHDTSTWPSATYPGKVTLSRVNMNPLQNPAFDAGKGWTVANIYMLSTQTEYRIEDFWIVPGWYSNGYQLGLKDQCGYRDPDVSATLWAWQEFKSDGTPYGPEVYGQPANYGSGQAKQQGDYLVWTRPSEDNIWNLSGGQARATAGIPAGGDFAPAAAVGTGYVA